MENEKALTIGFLGLGLIGGSIAKAIRRCHKHYTIIAYNYQPESTNSAFLEGCIDIIAMAADHTFSSCDILYLCMPVAVNEEYLPKIRPFLKPSCILTDVGSVKGSIHTSVRALGLERQFIGGHPMAGSEKTGYENATDHLLENAYYALTPEKETSPEALETLRSLTASIGAIPIILTPAEHDMAVAAISHLPHIIASGLVNLIKKEDSESGIMRTIAAGGFKDITRIASASPVMWQQICLSNKDNLTAILDSYLSYLSEIRNRICEADAAYLYDFFQMGRDYRNSIPNTSSGLIHTVSVVYCDLVDEAGSLAKVAKLLAENHISIKNIGITHSREFEEEALRIEFYRKRDGDLALEVLHSNHYRAVKSH